MSTEPNDKMTVAPIGRSKREIAKIADEAGVSAIDLAKYQKNAAIGKLFSEIGALNVGMGMYVLGAEKLMDAIERLADIIQATDDPELLATLADVQRKTIEAHREHATSIITAKGNESAHRTHKRTVLPPLAQVTAVVIKENESDEKKASVDI